MSRFLAFVGAVLTLWSPWAGAIGDPNSGASEQSIVEQWRSARVAELTSEQGWLTLVGLFWLEKGANSFGRAASNRNGGR